MSAPGSSSVSQAVPSASVAVDSDAAQDPAPNVASKKIASSVLEPSSAQPESQMSSSPHDGSSAAAEKPDDQQKSEMKPGLAEELPPSLDSGNVTRSESCAAGSG